MAKKNLHDDAASTLRARIRALGVATVAREAKLPASTLYSFCQDENRQLGMKTYTWVQIAVEYLESQQNLADHRAVDQKSEKLEFRSVPLLNQATGFSAQFNRARHPNLAKKMTELRLEESWLRSVTGRSEPACFAVFVTGNEVAPSIQLGDQALIDWRANRIGMDGDGHYLLEVDDRLIFSHCRLITRRGDFAINYTTTPSPLVSEASLKRSMIIGKVVWIGRAFA